MANLPTNRTVSNTPAEHVDDHNTLHAFHNLVDAKGDLIVGTAADTAGKLSVGTNGHILTADSSVAGGVKWAAPSGSSVAFTDYTPSNTNITVGNGTQVARYARIGTGAGSLIVVRYCLTWGSTTSFGGAIQIGLPVAAAATGIQGVVQGNAYSLDSGTAENLALATRLQLGSTTAIGVFGTTGVSVSNTQPHTWAVNDVLAVSVTYEAGA